MGRDAKLVVLGQGYVGLPLAVRAAEVGYRVVGVDPDEGRVRRLRAGQSYVEDVAAARLEEAARAGRYAVSTDPDDAAGFDVAVITVPTPLRDGAPDLSFVETATRALAAHVRPGCLVVLESTTYPGTTEELVRPLLEAGSGLRAGRDFSLGYSPERIDPGNTAWGLVDTPKVVAGVDPTSLAAVQAFFSSVVARTVPVSSCRAAELTKLLENTFRHVNIALVNEIAMLAHGLDIDVWEVLDAAATKPFGFMRFTPGPGVGGHCLPIDPSYLSWRVKRTTGRDFRFVELANEINAHMPDYVVQRAALALNRRRLAVNGSRVLLLGLAYKRDVGDVRESPAVRVAELLHGLGAEVRAVDPHVDRAWSHPDLLRAELDAAEVAAADLVLVLVAHRALDVALLEPARAKVLDVCRDDRLEGVERL